MPATTVGERSARGSITHLLAELSQGKPDAEAQLLPLVYQELRRVAAGYMRRERPDHTLQATALVNEAWLRLAALCAKHKMSCRATGRFPEAALHDELGLVRLTTRTRSFPWATS